MRQEIRRIGTALRTHDRTVLARYGGFNAAMKKSAETQESPGARVTEGISIDDLLDMAGRRCLPLQRKPDKRAGKPGSFGYVQTTALPAMSINKYLYIYL